MIEQLRDYQKQAIENAYTWFRSNSGNPCIVAPTGSGKSWIIAGLCEDIMLKYPTSKIIVLAHVKELLEQNADKIIKAWPEAPLGIYSAGLGQREIDTITVAGIQSVHRKAAEFGRIDLIIVDEAHLINNREQGMYRNFLGKLRAINPKLRVIGLTATPYRLGQGMITEGEDSLFNGLIESISITDLIKLGHLANLRSKLTDLEFNTDGIGKQNGDFKEKELQTRINTNDNNIHIVEETLRRSEDRASWLFFCTGVNHAMDMKQELIKHGIAAEAVTGKTPKSEREQIISDFRAGKIKALTNANVLTTGFDAPDIDLIVMARPTLSPGLYCQMAGRGMRVKSEGKYQDCLVLDFAGNILRHGPITRVTPPSKAKENTGEKIKKCPQCSVAVLPELRSCPECGFVFEERGRGEGRALILDKESDIMGEGGTIRMGVKEWQWRPYVSKKNGKHMLKVTFHPHRLLDIPVSMYVCPLHDGYAGQKARQVISAVTGHWLGEIDEDDLDELAEEINKASPPPDWVDYKRNGRFYYVLRWGKEKEQTNGEADRPYQS